MFEHPGNGLTLEQVSVVFGADAQRAVATLEDRESQVEFRSLVLGVERGQAQPFEL